MADGDDKPTKGASAGNGDDKTPGDASAANSENQPAPDVKADIQELVSFVHQFRGFLEKLVADGQFIPKDRHESVKAAWPDARNGLDELLAQLNRAHSSPSNHEGLGVLGLSGDSRKFKTEGFQALFFRWRKRMNRRWAQRVLHWSLPILESLAEHFKLHWAVKEFVTLVSVYVDGKAAK